MELRKNQNSFRLKIMIQSFFSFLSQLNKNQIKTDNLSNVQLKEFNFITTKVKKNYSIYDSEGEEVGHHSPDYDFL